MRQEAANPLPAQVQGVGMSSEDAWVTQTAQNVTIKIKSSLNIDNYY